MPTYCDECEAVIDRDEELTRIEGNDYCLDCTPTRKTEMTATLKPAVLRCLISREENLILQRAEAINTAIDSRDWTADDDKDWDCFQRYAYTQESVEESLRVSTEDEHEFLMRMLTVFFKQRLVIDKSIIGKAGDA